MDYYPFAFSLILYFSLHSILASLKVKSVLTRFLIPTHLYRLFYNLIAVATAAPPVYLYLQLGEQAVFGTGWPLRITGILLLICGLIIILYAMRRYDLNEFSGLDGVRKNYSPAVRLQTDGLHAFVRHPLYLGILLMVWGFFLFNADYKSFILAIIISLYLVIGTELEERKLIAEFGEDYLRYKKKAARFFPWKFRGK